MEEQPVLDISDDPRVLQTMNSETTTLARNVINSTTSKTSGSSWNMDGFASILEKEMLTYRFSWEPLMEALRALGIGLGQQGKEIYGLQASQEDMLETLEQRFGSCKDELSQIDTKLRQDMAHLYEQLAKLREQQISAQNQTPIEEQWPQWKKEIMEEFRQENKNETPIEEQWAQWKKEIMEEIKPEFKNETPIEGQWAQWKKEIMEEVRQEYKAAFDGILSYVTVPSDQNSGKNSHQSLEVSSLKTHVKSVDDLHDHTYESNPLYASQLASLDLKIQNIISQLNNNTSFAATTVTAAVGPSTAQLEQDIQLLHGSIEKKDKEIKDLQLHVDNLLLQSHTWFANNATSNNNSIGASGGESHGHRSNHSNGGEGGLDLSLVFTKLADLRRNTDASIDHLNERLQDLQSKTEEHEQNLTTLNLYMNEQVPENQLTLLIHSLEMEQAQVHGQQLLQNQVRPALHHAIEAADKGEMDGQILSKEYHKARQIIEPLGSGTNNIKRRVQQVKFALSQLIETPSATQDFYLSAKSQLAQADSILQANIVTEQQNKSLLRTLEDLRVKLDHQLPSHISEEDKKSSTIICRQQPSKTTSGVVANSRIDSHSLHQNFTSLQDHLNETIKRLDTLEHTLELRNNQGQADSTQFPSLDVDNARRSSLKASTNSKGSDSHSFASEQDLLNLRMDVFAEITKLSILLDGIQANLNDPKYHCNSSDTKSQNPHDAQAQFVQSVVTQMHTKDGNQLGIDELYDSLVKEITKKVTDCMLKAAEVKGQSTSSPASSVFGANGLNSVNQHRQMLDKFLQKVDTKLKQARDSTSQELHHVKKDLGDQLFLKLEAALRDLRAELMINYPNRNGDDSTAVGTKPSICIACSRPVPVSTSIRDAAVYPPTEAVALQLTHAHDPACEHHQDPEFVYRGGFRMPVNETRKAVALPVVSYTVASHRGQNSSMSRKEHGSVGKQQRGLTRFHHHTTNSHNWSRVKNVVREAEDLDRVIRQNHPNHQHH